MDLIKHYLLSALVAAVMMLCATVGQAGDNEGEASSAGTTSSESEAAAVWTGFGTSLLSAVVDTDGTLVRGSGATSSINANPGSYRVIFKRNVRQCTYVATIGIPGSVGTASPGEINVAGDATNVKGVFVDIQDSTGIDEKPPLPLDCLLQQVTVGGCVIAKTKYHVLCKSIMSGL